MTNVYFISGMGASCMVFDPIGLSEGFQKKYIEWILPDRNEPLANYAKRLAQNIDTTLPFVLVGYSFGGVLAQEIAKIHSPIKLILLATVSEASQIPFYFKLGKVTKFGYWFPKSVFDKKELIKQFFRTFIYRAKDKTHVNNDQYLTMGNSQYMGWAVKNILNWQPTPLSISKFHIHAADDPVFPAKYYKHSSTKIYWLPKGGHLMVLNFPRAVNNYIDQILEIEISEH